MDLITTAIAFALTYLLKPLGLGRLHRKRVLFFSYFGAQYSCNPKYLSEYLEEHHPDFELVWAFKSPEDYDNLAKRGITLVRMNSLRFVRTYLTSRYAITNSELPAWLPVSKRQTIINTWHGGGAYKRVGADFHKASRWRDMRSAMGRNKPCVYVSSSDAFTQLTIRESFCHTGEVIACGMPRNDLLVGWRDHTRRDVEARVRERLGIAPDASVLLYAPTYRESREAATYLFDFDAVRDALEKRFGGTWVILLRMHYLVMEQLPQSASYVDASAYDDMQELLYAADVLVTDYSSSIWDFGLTGKPCFLYATDLSTYDMERGFYSDIRTWPWQLAQSNEELVRAIGDFEAEAYEQRLRDHYRALGSKDTGHACEGVVAYLLEHL